jgi:hypothetical protein
MTPPCDGALFPPVDFGATDDDVSAVASRVAAVVVAIVDDGSCSRRGSKRAGWNHGTGESGEGRESTRGMLSVPISTCMQGRL